MSFNPDNPRRKALIAMSGGVDSSVAAYLAIESGLDCIGVTMKLFNNEDAGISREKSCCSLEDTEYARGVAYRLGMPYYVFNFTADFKEQVMRRFVEAYERGATPNPCIDCNRYLKFDRLYRRAKELGCEYVVTGHYAQIEEENGRFLLKKAVDPTKDQSYVLYSMTQDELRHTLFPLGGMTKTHTRELARKLGFYNADKPDSQDICFVPDGDYASFIRSFTGRDYPRGEFVDKSGNVLGEHKGLIGYTVGQRKGLGIALGEPRYVTALMPKENRVVLGSNEELFRRDGSDFLNYLKNCQGRLGDQADEELVQMRKTCAAIMGFVHNHPEQLPRVRRYREYYMPTTRKLLNTALGLGESATQNAQEIRRDIVGILHTLNTAYEKLYDTLLQDVSMDVSTEIDTLEAMLNQDGLTHDFAADFGAK